jgi:hypothetical protein
MSSRWREGHREQKWDLVKYSNIACNWRVFIRPALGSTWVFGEITLQNTTDKPMTICETNFITAFYDRMNIF